MSRTYLVTGAAGFIGSHTAGRLVERGDRVIGLDNLNDYYSPERKRRNVEEVRALGGDFEFVEGDFRDRAFVSRLFSAKTIDAVAHLGAMAGVRASVDDPWLYYDTNLNGTLHLLDAASRFGKPNFVFASTSSAYGPTERLPFVESDTADRPLAPYPASKRAGELLGHSYHHNQGLDFTALRFFTVYGPRGRPDMLAHLLLDALREDRPLTLYNGGRMVRDWTYVGDIVSAVVAALDRRLRYEIINVGRGEPIVLRDFVDCLAAHTGKTPRIVDRPMMAADMEATSANIDKARRLLDYTPNTSVAEGTLRFYEWYRRNIGAIG